MFAVTYNSKCEPDQPLYAQKIEPDQNGTVSFSPPCGVIIDTKGPLEVIVGVGKYILEGGRHYFAHGILPFCMNVSIPHQPQAEFSVTKIIASSWPRALCETSIILPMFKGVKRYTSCIYGSFVDSDDIIYSSNVDVDGKWYEYDHTDIVVSAYWCDTNIATIIEDPEITQYLTTRDDFIRYSDKPCVPVSYKPENDKALRDVLLSKYNLTFKGTRGPKRTVHIKTPEQIHTEFESELDKIIAKLMLLKSEGVITELHVLTK